MKTTPKRWAVLLLAIGTLLVWGVAVSIHLLGALN